MRIRLLDNKLGVILSRTPIVVTGDLPVLFDGAPQYATALFSANGMSFYRELKDGACLLPFKALNGTLSVSVKSVDKAGARRWECEAIRAQPQEDGRVLLCPDDMDLPRRVVELYLENQELRRQQDELRAMINKTNARLDAILEGYDIT